MEDASGAAGDPVSLAVGGGHDPHDMGPDRRRDRAVALGVAESHHLAGRGDEPVPGAVGSRGSGHDRVRSHLAPGTALVEGIPERVDAAVGADQPVTLAVRGGDQGDDGRDEVGAERGAVIGGPAQRLHLAVGLGEVVGELGRHGGLRACGRLRGSERRARGALGNWPRRDGAEPRRGAGIASAEERTGAEPEPERDRDNGDHGKTARPAPATHDRCHCHGTS